MSVAIFTSDAPRPLGSYSQAVRSGNTLYISGQIPIDIATGKYVPASIESESEKVLRYIGAILSEAELRVSSVVKVSIFLADMAFFPVVNACYGRFFGSHAPARETVAVKGLPLGVKVEMSCIAVANS